MTKPVPSTLSQSTHTLPTILSDSDALDSQPWLQFKRPLVRDLAYALGCPPVLLHIPKCIDIPQRQGDITLPDTACWQQHFLDYLPRLMALESDPKPLNRFLAQHLTSFRLGFRFEGLLLFWLLDSAYHHYELIAHNIQLFAQDDSQHSTAGQHTIGELDFLVHNKKTHATEHWEVAIKFFLGEAPFSPAHWKGLKGTDNLARKMQHMINKSFRYEQVTVDGITHKIDKRVAIIKGRFYEPTHQMHALSHAKQSGSLSWLNPALPRGIWYNHIPEDAQTQPDGWRNGRRVEWFTKRDCYDAFDLGTHPKQLQDAIHQFSGRRQPLTWHTGLYFRQSLATDNSIHTSDEAVMLRLD